MHVVIFRLASAIALLFVFALVLGACAAPKERNVWREMIISKFSDGMIAKEWVVTDCADCLLLSRKR